MEEIKLRVSEENMWNAEGKYEDGWGGVETCIIKSSVFRIPHQILIDVIKQNILLWVLN